MQHGFAHKVERLVDRLKAFIAGATPDPHQAPAYLIYRIREAVTEIQPQLSRGALERTTKDAGFVIEQAVVEAEGVWPNCR